MHFPQIFKDSLLYFQASSRAVMNGGHKVLNLSWLFFIVASAFIMHSLLLVYHLIHTQFTGFMSGDLTAQ